MSQEGFLAQKPRSPGSLAIVIALHAAAITALALSKMEVPEFMHPGPIKVKNIPLQPDPPPIPPEPKSEVLPQEQKTVISTVPPKVPTIRPDDFVIADPTPAEPIIIDTRPPGPRTIPEPAPLPPPPLPKPEPVRKDAQIDARSELQPPYPASEERAGNEGSVTIRVRIGTDGRVKGVEKVRAASDAFWRATERHALRNWRFRPATLDGKPIESSKTMTVHFQLTG